MKTPLYKASQAKKQAMALIMVITSVALITILMVAIFSVTRTEYKSTLGYVAARSAKQLGDTATSVVQAQIQNGHYDPVNNNSEYSYTNKAFHVTQPGMVRVYNADGSFKSAYKLFSSSNMKVTGSAETVLFAASEQVPTNWKTLTARYVDLNDPVIRPSLATTASAAAPAVFFPVIDPRAAYNFLGSQTPSSTQQTTQVEGFSYDKITPTGAGNSVTYNEVLRPSDVSDPTQLRLPMPVEWIYILQDGSMGTLDASNTFVPSTSGVVLSTSNPIVGRVAFWTDDESCKVNINTAAEPTFSAPPFYYHARDYNWANFPPSTGEYQRYPGHPATVALSSVLAPNLSLDPFNPASGLTKNNILAIKNYIYDVAPKIASGGSQAGTLPFALDDFSSANGETANAQLLNVSTVAAERLFANVDELLFQDSAYNTKGRQANKWTMPNGRDIFDHDTLERTRFFLTAHSRAPEFTMFGLPRIAVWPVADESMGTKYRTSYDQTIALCATLRGTTAGAAIPNSYIFRRAQAHHATHDVTGASTQYSSSQGLQRNSSLLNLLYAQMATLTWPQTSSLGSSAQNYVTKYGANNVAQLAVQFFDYIRCTNLYDGVLARGNNGMSANGKSSTALYAEADNLANTYLTYTNQRITPAATGSLETGTNRVNSDNSGVVPGHGQVTPAVWQKGNTSYRGFGRMFTLSEVGLQFICTADGLNDAYAVNFNGQTSGGGTAPRANPTIDGQSGGMSIQTNAQAYGTKFNLPAGEARWYSNFPPLLGSATPPILYGVDPSTPAGTNQFHPSKHPGYDPNNWNMTLPNNTPLLADEKRVQALFTMESFCPMLGWTKFFPEWAIVLDGNFIAGMKLNGQALFDTTSDVVVKSNGNLFEAQNVYSFGGHAGPAAMSGGRDSRPISGTGQVLMPSDPGFITGNTSGHNALTNYGLSSNYITVKRNQPMQLSFGTGEVIVKIYDKHDYTGQSRQPIQIIRIKFQDSALPVPSLVYSSEKGNPVMPEVNYRAIPDSFGRMNYYRSVQGPHWWCFNSQGCLGRLDGQVNPNYTPVKPPFWLQNPTPYPPGTPDSALRQTLRGRLDTAAAGVGINTGIGGAWHSPSIIPDETASIGGWQGSDVIRTMVPACGDYRLIAARYDVPSTMWMRHPLWTGSATDQKLIHSFSNCYNDEAGYKLPTAGSNQLLVAGVQFGTSTTDGYRTPDLPPHDDWGKAANRYGDFDTGIANARLGPYVNKPDEGNFFAGNFTRNNVTKYYRSGYFYNPWNNSDDWRSGVFMTPNRIISSPVMFGSLSTGIWNEGSSGQPAAGVVSSLPGKPWQTLLFRPYAQSNSGAGGVPVSQGHPGDFNPRDHFLLDMFFMPVVEPYAISEPLSVAGRINLNYQIMPFTNIRRATALHALMKGEYITTIPILGGHPYKSKTFKTSTGSGTAWDTYWDEKTDGIYYHRPIDVKETLVQFDEKFNNQASGANHSLTRVRGLFRSASQICEIHLIPDTTGRVTPQESNTSLKGLSASGRQGAMDNFWQTHSVTGDNVRERPYSNLYSRVTTRTNTFRVHVRAQVLKKARSTNAAIFDPIKDAVLSEYRGSTLIERYIDPNDRTVPIPDYATASNPLSLPPLESFYRFRTLESKRFSP